MIQVSWKFIHSIPSISLHNQETKLVQRLYQVMSFQATWILGWLGALAGCFMMLSVSCWRAGSGAGSDSVPRTQSLTAPDRWQDASLCIMGKVGQGRGRAGVWSMKLWEKCVPDVLREGRKTQAWSPKWVRGLGAGDERRAPHRPQLAFI